jgi:chromate transporter
MPEVLNIFIIFLKIGFFTFGGGYAVIPLFTKELVEIHKIITHEELVNMVMIASAIPGPIMFNVPVLVGLKKAGILGAVFSVFGILLPAVIFLILIALFFNQLNKYKQFQSVMNGMRPAIIGLIIVTIFVVAKSGSPFGLKDGIITFASIIGIMAFNIHPIIIILLSAFIGFFLYK